MQVQASVRSMAVVMIDEDAENTLEMTNVCDQYPVQTFGSNGPNEPFRDSVRLRGLNWRTNDSDALGMRRGIKAVREFAIVVSNQKMNGVRCGNSIRLTPRVDIRE